MTIRERMIRRNSEDIIYIGDLVEQHVRGEFGEILTALTQGRVTEEALQERSNLSADRILGRIAMAATLSQDLEQYIIDRDDLMRPIHSEKSFPETTIASEVGLPEQRGGEI